jgi:glycosyltransferase involved in cell wall biosynthesis
LREKIGGDVKKQKPECNAVLYVTRLAVNGRVNGFSEYSNNIISGLVAKGCSVKVLCTEPFVSGALPYHKLNDRHGHKNVEYRYRSAIRLGSYLIGINIVQWLNFIMRCLRILSPSWNLAPLNQDELKYVKREVSIFPSSRIFANYFYTSNLSKIKLENTLICVSHDVFQKRKSAFADSGYEFDFKDSQITNELMCLNKFDHVLAIHGEDRDFLSDVLSGPEVHLAPMSFELKSNVQTPRSANTVIFVGSNNQPNKKGVNDFIQQVIPLIDPKFSLKLLVVGNVSLEGVVPECVTVLGRLDSLDDVYSMAKLAIVPLTFGSGLKIKAAESLAYGVPVVGTSVGLEGLKQSAFVRIANNGAEMVQAIESLFLLDRDNWLELSRGSLEYVQTNFSEQRLVATLDSCR